MDDEAHPESADSQETPADEEIPFHETTADDAISSIQATDLGVPQIPYYLVERHQNKTTKLLSNSGEVASIQAKNRWHDYDFARPLFIGFVDIVGTDLSNNDEYVFSAKLEGGGKKEFKGKPQNGSIRIDINEFCKSVSFKPPSIFWAIFRRNPELQKVSIYGFYKENLGEFLYKISRTGAIKNAAVEEIDAVRRSTNESIGKLEIKETELAEIDHNISDAQLKIETLNTAIAEKVAQESEERAKLDRSTENLNAILSQVDEKREELNSVTKQRENERAEVDLAKKELKKLKEDINLFPSEISGFVDQASKDVRLYTIFVGCMVVVVCGLFIWVLKGAFDLSEYVKEHPDVSIFSLLLAKMPLATVVSALAAASYKIAKVFIEEMLRINRQKLSLTQVSIIAKDVSHAAESDLELSEVEVYGLRLRAKMAMLADHIRTFIPSAPAELLPQSIFSVFDRSHRKVEPSTAHLDPSDVPTEIEDVIEAVESSQ